MAHRRPSRYLLISPIGLLLPSWPCKWSATSSRIFSAIPSLTHWCLRCREGIGGYQRSAVEVLNLQVQQKTKRPSRMLCFTCKFAVCLPVQQTSMRSTGLQALFLCSSVALLAVAACHDDWRGLADYCRVSKTSPLAKSACAGGFGLSKIDYIVRPSLRTFLVPIVNVKSGQAYICLKASQHLGVCL